MVLPANLKKHLDLNSGNDRGRIYRVVADGFKQPTLPKLGRASTAELVQTLAHPNGWHRDTALRLIYERRDKTAIPGLRQLLKKGSGYGPLYALYGLQSLNGLAAEDIHFALASAERRFAHARAPLVDQPQESGERDRLGEAEFR